MYKTIVLTLSTFVRLSLLVDELEEALQRKCERTFRRAYADDWDFLFLNILYDPRLGEDKDISSFFVRALVFFAFFEKYTPSSTMDINSSIQPRVLDLDSQVGEETSLQIGSQL
jgi:hypothetical protein